jgi:hypothetical protein
MAWPPGPVAAPAAATVVSSRAAALSRLAKFLPSSHSRPAEKMKGGGSSATSAARRSRSPAVADDQRRRGERIGPGDRMGMRVVGATSWLAAFMPRATKALRQRKSSGISSSEGFTACHQVARQEW